MHLNADMAGPILCFGGPYSNLQATQAMYRQATRLGIPPERTICTGDIVAYCANPNETARLLRDWGCHVIKGNVEESLANRADDCGCGFGDGTACDLLSRGWYAHTNTVISDDLRDWMAALPETLTFDFAGRRLRVVHGGVRETSRFLFASTPAEELAAELEAADASIVVAGHCGLPFSRQIGGALWFNPGVIGMPANDGTPDVWYGLLHLEDGRAAASHHRLTYDWQSAAQELQRLGTAPPYAEALGTGIWPSIDVLPDFERRATGRRIEDAHAAIH